MKSKSGNKSHSCIMLGGRKTANIEKKIQDLVEEKINKLGYELYDVEYVKEGKDYYLRIYIDNKTGISLEDCEKVNNAITDTLDEADYIKEQYFLEISSCGLERILRKDKHLVANRGKEIEIKLFKTFDGKKQYRGILNSFDEDSIIIDIENLQKRIPRKEIAQIKTIYEW